jgi:hypothetical protein
MPRVEARPRHLPIVEAFAAAVVACGDDQSTNGIGFAGAAQATSVAPSTAGDHGAADQTTNVAPTSAGPDATAAQVTSAAPTTAGPDATAAEPSFHWPLEGAGAADTGSIDLTAYGAATWSPQGLVLDGTTGYAATAEPGPIDTSASFTVTAWVKPDGIVAYPNVVSQLSAVAGAFFLGYGENTWQFPIKPADSNEPGVTRRIETGIVNSVPTTWTHLAGVYDHDRGTAQLYVNGHPATPDGVEVPAPFAATGALHIGNAQAHAQPADFWNATIADVGLYLRALDDNQIRQLVDATAPASATFDAPPPPVEQHCPNPQGGTCLGRIPAGTYTTTTFQPSITYTLPDGWNNGEDLPGNFLLQLDGDPRYLGIYRNVTAPFGDCEERADPDVQPTVDSFSDWLTSHPGLDTTEPEPVTIGGLDGIYLDIGLDPNWTTTCFFSEGKPVVPFVIGAGPSSLDHVIHPGFHERPYLLEYDDSNIAIEVGPGGASLPNCLEQVITIIDSLRFTS